MVPKLLFLLALQNIVVYSCCIPVEIVIETREWADEITWETVPPSEAFFDDEYQDNSVYHHHFCLPPITTYVFVAKDYWGDGWNGGKHNLS